jgi:hypothetical protein
MTTRRRLLSTTCLHPLYDSLPQTVYVRTLWKNELPAEQVCGYTHGVWREYDGLLCVASSLALALESAWRWTGSKQHVVYAH